MAARKRGRNTKYEEARVKKILDLLKQGNTRVASSMANGICDETFLNWMNNENGKTGDFKDRVLEAEALFAINSVKIIQKAAKDRKVTVTTVKKYRTFTEGGPQDVEETTTKTHVEFDWQASAWLLERRRGKDFGKRVDVTSGDEPIEAVTIYGALSEEEIDRRLAESQTRKAQKNLPS